MKKIISIILVLILVSSSFVFAETDSIRVEVNNEELVLDVELILVDGLALLPLRAVFESLGLEVSWDGVSRTVTGKDEDRFIELSIEEDQASVNGKTVELDKAVVIIDQRTLVSGKFIEDATGAKVAWDENARIVSINKSLKDTEDYKNTLRFSNLADEESQEQVRMAMESAGIPEESIDFFFDQVDDFNSAVEEKSLVDGFTTIDSLEPEYDLLWMQEMWDAKYPTFIGYNCRIVTFDLMKDVISIGKADTTNANWLVFDENALEYNPKDIFTAEEKEKFQTLYSYVPTELTQDISVHLENIKEDWKNKEIEFSNEDERSIVSVFFHDELGYLFIGHMGVLIPSENGELLFIEKLSFHAPYQAVKFNNRSELNDYLMNKYDISWNQPTARPIIMENGELLEGYRPSPNNREGN